MNAEKELLTLVSRRTIRATPEVLFEAWTQPEHLKKWWGPRPVTCTDAEVDLRVGGRYRIGNQLPDGNVLWIWGEFEVIDAPGKLVYTWSVGNDAQTPERVTVQFNAAGNDTEVVITHQRIPDAAMRGRHEQGWSGCLDGLAAWAADTAA